MRKQRVILSWSGGKDSALAYEALLKSPHYKVSGLLTTIDENNHHVLMHHAPLNLVEAQAKAMGQPLHVVNMPPGPSNKVYEKRMSAMLGKLKKQGNAAIAFGDIFLEDLRKYREQMMGQTGMDTLFPLWQKETGQIIKHFVDHYKAVVNVIDAGHLPLHLTGHPLDRSFVDQLPNSVDPCGENGEYHSFVTDARYFSTAVPVRVGAVSEVLYPTRTLPFYCAKIVLADIAKK